MKTTAIISTLAMTVVASNALAQQPKSVPQSRVEYRWNQQFVHGSVEASVISRDSKFVFTFFCGAADEGQMGWELSDVGSVLTRWPSSPIPVQIVVDGVTYPTALQRGAWTEGTRHGKSGLEALTDAIAKTKSSYFMVEIPAMNWFHQFSTLDARHSLTSEDGDAFFAGCDK